MYLWYVHMCSCVSVLQSDACTVLGFWMGVARKMYVDYACCKHTGECDVSRHMCDHGGTLLGMLLRKGTQLSLQSRVRRSKLPGQCPLGWLQGP